MYIRPRPSYPTRRSSDLAQLARSVGVADTQISRWRRGQVVPTLQYLQRLADTFGIDRLTLDQLVGLPVAQSGDRKSTRLNSSHVRISSAVFFFHNRTDAT